MSDVLPKMDPMMLSGLTYAEAKRQMKVTGCGLRRPHWCAPMLVWEHGRVWFDDEEELLTWEEAAEDMAANDWIMVKREGGPDHA